MKALKPCFFVFAVWVLPAMNLQAEDKSLITGKWQVIQLLTVLNGNVLAPKKVANGYLLEFKQDLTWQLMDGARTASGQYKWLGEAQIEQRYAESSVPAWRNTQRQLHIQFVDKQLFLTQITPGSPATKITEVLQRVDGTD